MVSKLAKIALIASGTLVTFTTGVGVGAIAIAYAMSKASELTCNHQKIMDTASELFHENEKTEDSDR